MILFLFLLHFSQSYAYETLERAQDLSQINMAIRDHRVQRRLRLRCQIEKERSGLLWPCYMLDKSPELKLTLIEQCHNKLPEVRHIGELPSMDQMKQLPRPCQKRIRAQRAILDYKAQGS